MKDKAKKHGLSTSLGFEQKYRSAIRHLKSEIAQRKAVENTLKKNKGHYTQLLKQSRQMQEHFRDLSRKILLAQEKERKEISRELHDEIAQILTGINVQLATLKPVCDCCRHH